MAIDSVSVIAFFVTVLSLMTRVGTSCHMFYTSRVKATLALSQRARAFCFAPKISSSLDIISN